MLAIGAGVTPASAAGAEPDRVGSLPSAIESYVAGTQQSTGLPGLSVVVTRGSKVVYAGGRGHDGRGAPVEADSAMRVASVSKSFTAAAVMTLVDRGRVVLDGPVADQVPGFAMVDPRSRLITVRELLDQTSGLTDATVDIPALRGSMSLADYVARLRTGALATAPGARFAYCNVNYDLAARLVEVASGVPFADYMRRAVFEPLGMRATTVDPERIGLPRGYDSLFGLWLPRAERAPAVAVNGSGGVITTAADMGRWLVFQNGGGAPLLRRSSLVQSHTPAPGRDYAMGWGAEVSPGGTPQLVHGGNLYTYNAVEAIVPSTGYGFAVMTNGAAEYDDTYDVLTGLVTLSQGQPTKPPGGTRQLTDTALAAATVLFLGLGIVGAWRARRWADRRVEGSRSRMVVGLVVPLVPVVLFAAYPDLVSVLTRRTVSWDELFYFAIGVTVALGVAASAGAATIASRLARLVALRRSRGVGAPRASVWSPP